MSSRPRLFIAAFPDDDARDRLRHLSSELADRTGGRAIPPENLHLSLRFLGNTGSEASACVQRGLDRMTGVESVSLVFDQVELRVRQRMAWIQPSAVPPTMAGLIREIEKVVSACGFPVEDRDYLPHLTLVRKTSPGPRPAAKRIVSCDPIEMFIQQIELVESETLPEGSRYTRMKRWRLTGADGS